MVTLQALFGESGRTFEAKSGSVKTVINVGAVVRIAFRPARILHNV